MSGPEPMTGPDAILTPSLGSRLEPDARLEPTALGVADVRRICRAACLLGIVGEVLSAHEVEIIKAVGRRYLTFGVDARVSPAEWTVLEDATSAMARSARASLALRGWPFDDGRAS